MSEVNKIGTRVFADNSNAKRGHNSYFSIQVLLSERILVKNNINLIHCFYHDILHFEMKAIGNTGSEVTRVVK